MAKPALKDLVHPEYAEHIRDWLKFELVAEGGSEFIEAYLQKFSAFEAATDFDERKKLSYNPCHAAAAVRQVKNAIFQRLVDVRREGGPESYQKAVENDVDRKSKGMNAFLGEEVIPDLLFIGKIGVMVDMPPIEMTASIADTASLRPYLYTFDAKDILNWLPDDSNEVGRFKKLSLRVRKEVLDEEYGLPVGFECETWIYSKLTGSVEIKIYDKNDELKRTLTLKIGEIPFVLFDIEDSLLKDIADYQISMLQLGSSDINFLFKSNFPIYTEQQDPKFNNSLRTAPATGTGTAESARSGFPVPTTLEARVTRTLDTQNDLGAEGVATLGSSRGRAYGKDLDRPDFINPSSEPVLASMKKQEKMAEDIRVLLDLALTSLGARYASGESKAKDSAGLEAGLSYIGLICQRGEQEIARLWALFEKAAPAKVTYPTNYSLRTDADRQDEAKTLKELSGAVASKTFAKNMQKKIASVLLVPRTTPEEIAQIINEIDKAAGITSDSETLRQDAEAGFVSQATASKLRGYADGEAEKAAKDHEERTKRIAQAQADAAMKVAGQNKADSVKGKDTTLNDTTKSTDRGTAKS